jgi:cytoskeletal protein CcmA (bactofilin family)
MKIGSSKEKTKRIDTVIGQGTRFEGTLTSREGLRIDGEVKGRVECQGSLVIGSDGNVEAEIVADKVYIAGQLNGNVTAKSHLEITEKGRVYGDIATSNLVVGEGVIFEGKCRMISSQDPEEAESLPELVSFAPSSSC